jgi:hypothetical protein
MTSNSTPNERESSTITSVHISDDGESAVIVKQVSGDSELDSSV